MHEIWTVLHAHQNFHWIYNTLQRHHLRNQQCQKAFIVISLTTMTIHQIRSTPECWEKSWFFTVWGFPIISGECIMQTTVFEISMHKTNGQTFHMTFYWRKCTRKPTISGGNNPALNYGLLYPYYKNFLWHVNISFCLQGLVQSGIYGVPIPILQSVYNLKLKYFEKYFVLIMLPMIQSSRKFAHSTIAQ